MTSFIPLLVAAVLGATSLDTAVPTSRWLARCSAVPVSAADGLTVLRSYHRPGVYAWDLTDGTRRGQLVCYPLVEYPTGSGYWVTACRGPTALRDRMAVAPECSHVLPWGQVTTLPAAALSAVASGLVCCGEGTRSGRTVTAWRCDQSAALGGPVTVSRLDGYGPGVVGARGPCADYAASE